MVPRYSRAAEIAVSTADDDPAPAVVTPPLDATARLVAC
jgi:hypothetical protein